MTARLVWTRLARANVSQIYRTIAAEQPTRADRIIGKVQRNISALADHPRLGLRRAEIFPTARMLVEASYVILYETHPDNDDEDVQTVEIVRVLDGRRDLDSLF